MTDNLPALFEGKEIRVTGPADDPWFPVYDLAMAWGIDRNTPRNLIDRNKEIFDGMTCYVTYPSENEGDERALCVNERGLYLMLGRINADRLKNPEARATIIRFQRWVPELIQRYRKHEIAEVRPQDPPTIRLLSDDVREALKVARIISEETGISLPIAQSFALEKVGAGDWQKLLPAATMPTGYLTPTDIGNRIGYSARQVNLWLYNNKLQVKDATNRDEWRLTEAGKQYAEEFPFTRNTHSGYQIKWRESILQLMNVQGSGQAVLSAG